MFGTGESRSSNETGFEFASALSFESGARTFATRNQYFNNGRAAAWIRLEHDIRWLDVPVHDTARFGGRHSARTCSIFPIRAQAAVDLPPDLARVFRPPTNPSKRHSPVCLLHPLTARDVMGVGRGRNTEATVRREPDHCRFALALEIIEQVAARLAAAEAAVSCTGTSSHRISARVGSRPAARPLLK